MECGITVPADFLASNGAGASAGTVMIKSFLNIVFTMGDEGLMYLNISTFPNYEIWHFSKQIMWNLEGNVA